MEIKFSNIYFAYGENKAPILRDFSLTAKAGDVICIKGASGSGKTTLFKLLLGFEYPTKGKITFNDKELKSTQLTQLRKQSTWLPQDLNLGEGKLKEVFYYPFSFKANEVIRPGEEYVLTTFEALGLNKNIWDEEFKNLSTGQRQRVGLALCHLLSKDIMLLDEPTSALDQRSKERVEKLLFDKEKIIISTSHDPWWLERCTQIVELEPTS
ncbi:ATP-binding cassette domain-containing protein [Fulvivirga sp. RKSG066]|uniref:ABC transporter ATP-binding protein n=1 Tax=Fulvivirga aurantia TaxID=2529383 RepID=UPI0012BC88C6|nr:ABC transporter ATP-binding protein [Fulvivirga aurantia]MTI21511.1 ATP-binding cassette domain-containing protein [Fulvivirga aurantia]